MQQMNMTHLLKSALCILTLTTMACSKEQTATSGTSDPQKPKEMEPIAVTTKIVQPEMFAYDLVSNGKVEAGEYVDMRFVAHGAAIDRIMVSNGQRVNKGQVIATLDQFTLENTVASARNTLERSRLDLADALIGQGYSPEQTAAVPAEVMRLARLRSGVPQAELQLREAERALAEATLCAPFDGVVANLTQKVGNLPDGSRPFCRIMSTTAMEVQFTVLESELPLLHVGDEVEVAPFSTSSTYRGAVASINPIVDNNGMVAVCAKVKAANGLYDGMNVRVNVKREVEQALVVPKTAVVLRSNGRQVLFTHQDGRSIWHYVTTGLENMTEYVITEGLQPGQEVIVSGNLNLVHEGPVTVSP